jgi:DNA-binding response OmpR family regulator
VTETPPPYQLLLTERRVLVVEDNFFIADDAHKTLKKAGAKVVGPTSTIHEAIGHLADTQIDAAVLDVNLGGVMSYPVARELEARGIPFLFASGYDDWAVPAEWQHIPRLQKPYDLRELPEAVAVLLMPGGPRS